METVRITSPLDDTDSKPSLRTVPRIMSSKGQPLKLNIKQKWYEVTPIIDAKLTVDKTLPPHFLFLYLKQDEQIKTYVSADVPLSTLKYFGNPKPRYPLLFDRSQLTEEDLAYIQATGNDIYIKTKIYGKEALLKRIYAKEFYDFDFAIHDIMGVLDTAPDNVAVMVGVSADPKLAYLVRSKMKHIADKNPLDPLVRYLQNVIKEIPCLVRVIVLSDDKKKRDFVANDISTKINKRITWKNLFFNDWLKVLDKVKPPKLSFGNLLVGGTIGFTNLTSTQKIVSSWLKMPDPKVHPVEFAAERRLPTRVTIKKTEDSFTIGQTPDGAEVFLSPKMLERHLYVIGQSGSGKTTFLKTLVHGLAEQRPGAVIVIDPHGDFAEEIAREIPDAVYLHPIDSPFAFNPLDLPPHLDRDLAITLATDALLGLFTNVFKLLENAVNVRYLLRVVLRYLYTKTDSPTLGMMYKTILMLYSGALNLEIEDEEFERQLRVLRDMPEQSFISALARLEPFANDAVLRTLTSQTTIPFDSLIKRKKIIAISVPKAKVGEIVSSLLTATILLYVWYYAISRPVNHRIPIYVVIDEFQNLQGLATVETILSEARKYGLHLILSHQHTKQIDEPLLQSILTNCATKVIFQVGGMDVEMLKKLDPNFEKDIEKLVSHLRTGEAVVKMPPSPDEDMPPVLTKIKMVKKQPVRSEIFSTLYAPTSTDQQRIEEVICPVLKYIEPPYFIAHKIMTLIAQEGQLSTSKIKSLLPVGGKHVNKAILSLLEKNYIESIPGSKSSEFRIKKDFYSLFYPSAPSDEGRELVNQAIDYYLLRDNSVNPVKLTISEDRPDMVVIPFRGMKLGYSRAIAVEIEAHPRKEFVLRNLTKSSVNDFAEIHIWVHRRNVVHVAQALKEYYSTQSEPKPITVFTFDEITGKVSQFDGKEVVSLFSGQSTAISGVESVAPSSTNAEIISHESTTPSPSPTPTSSPIPPSPFPAPATPVLTKKDKEEVVGPIVFDIEAMKELIGEDEVNRLIEKYRRMPGAKIIQEGNVVEIKFEEATSTSEAEQRADRMSQEPQPAIEDLLNKSPFEEAMADEPVIDEPTEEPAEKHPLTDLTQPAMPTTPFDDVVESPVDDQPEEPKDDVQTHVEEVREPVTEPVSKSADEPRTEPAEETVMETERELVREPTPHPEHETSVTSDGKKEKPNKTNVESFFIEDKVVVLPGGKKVALFASSRAVEKVRNMLRDPDVSCELHPTPPPSQTYILVIYKRGLSVGTYRCRMLSEDFNLI